jgi:hypothetical protein
MAKDHHKKMKKEENWWQFRKVFGKKVKAFWYILLYFTKKKKYLPTDPNFENDVTGNTTIF